MVPKNSLIVSDPDILGGAQVIKGTRIPVSLLSRLIKVGYPDSVISYEYPSLSAKKILAFKKLMSTSVIASFVPEPKQSSIQMDRHVELASLRSGYSSR